VKIEITDFGFSSPSFQVLLPNSRSLAPLWSHLPDPRFHLSSRLCANPLNSCSLPLGKVDISLLANDVSVTTTNTLDLSQGVLYVHHDRSSAHEKEEEESRMAYHDLALSINVGVEETQDVLELHVCFRDDERHGCCTNEKGAE